MLQGNAQQQGQNAVLEAQPAPLYAPEQPEPEFTVDEGHIPLHQFLWKNAEENATTGLSLLGNLKARATNAENDIKGKFLGFLLSHRITRTLGTAAAAFLTPPENFLTNEQYEKSQYQRPELKFPNGVYENLAAIEAKRYDDQQIFKDLQARTDQGTWPTIAKGASTVAGGLANPLFWLFGGAAGEIAAPAAEFMSDLIPEIKALSPEAQATIKGFAKSTGIGGAIMPVFSGIDYAEEKVNQEDASVKNILYSIPIGMGFGFAGEGLSHVLSSRSPVLKSEFAEKEGLNKKAEEEPESVVQEPSISPNNHETMLKTSVSQLENGKLPEVSEIAKQNYHDDWQNNLGNKLREDPEFYTKELEDLKKARDINQNKLDKINNELDRLEKENVPLVDERVSSLMEDKNKLLAKNFDIEDMIATRENAPEASDMQDVHSKIEKMQSPQSDFSYYKPKEAVEIPPEEKSINDLLEQERNKFNARKKEMIPEIQELADTEDIKQKNKGTKKFLNIIDACLRRTK